MRIIFPSASIAAFTSSYLVSAAVVKAHDLAGEQRIEKVARGVDESFQSSNTRKRSLDEECNTFKSGGDSAEENAESGLTDVGILAGCGPKQTCEPDGSSLLGGRCTMSNVSAQLKLPSKPVSMAAFPKRRGRRTNQIQRALRFLQETDATTDDAEEEQVCPPNCPQQFCDCAFDDGDANKCAYELHSVCINDLLDKCVPDSSMSFYTDTYCPFAECIALEGKSYEECTCAYYANYCNVYYAYLESIEKCAVSNCCDGQPDGMKYTCIPALQPTGNPTMAPIFSPHPSSSPTISSMPTISSAPTVSPVPTVTPTITPKPTVSMAPNSLSPTEPPTTSTAPSSASPTVTAAPTVSHAPTDFPTVTAAPTISSMPSTLPPVDTEVTTSEVPTEGGMESEQLTAAPVDAPASERSSGRVVQSTNFILASLVVSVGGVMWLFV